MHSTLFPFPLKLTTKQNHPRIIKPRNSTLEAKKQHRDYKTEQLEKSQSRNVPSDEVSKGQKKGNNPTILSAKRHRRVT